MSSSVQYTSFASNSFVWEHFLKSTTESNDGLTAKCKLCKMIIKTTTARSTKGLHVHLKSKHRIEDISKTVLTNAASSSSTNPDPELSSIPAPKRMRITDHFPIQCNECSMEERVSRMAAKDGLPLSVFITSTDLRELFKAKGHSLPRSSTSIRMMIMNYGMTLSMKILHEMSELKESDHRFSLTFDEWTSSGSRRYLNINVHAYVNDRALFWNLGLSRIFRSMPATVCVEMLRKKLKDFDLDLDTDITAITTDAASVMIKTGTLIPASQQLCYAHGLQLGILDVIYEKKELESIQQGEMDALLPENIEADTNHDGQEISDSFEGSDSSNTTNDVGGFVVELSSNIEVYLIPDYKDLIDKVRKTVQLFKSSPVKNDLLQEYVQKEFGRKIQLTKDCKTRWSSLATMIEKFNKLKICIVKTLLDLGLSTNIQHRYSEHDLDALVNLENTLTPVKLAVEVLCRQDANLITAEATLKFMIRKLEETNSSLATKLASSLRQRISQRRTNLTAILLYLQNPSSYNASRDDETFYLPTKTLLRKEIKDFITRMQFSLSNSSAENNNNEDVQQRDKVTNNEEVSDPNLTLQQELELTISSASQLACPSPSRANSLESIIKKEMNLYESGGSIGKYLSFTYKALKAIPPTSVEAERAFSAAGYFASKIRSSLGDDTLDMLCFLRKHFQQDADC